MKRGTNKLSKFDAIPLGASKEYWTDPREQLLDEALKDTFPASDPPSIAVSWNDRRI